MTLSRTLRRLLISVGLAPLALCTGLASAQAAANVQEDRQWQFKVFLDAREIGSHDYRITRKANALRVESRARFDVKVLFFNAFRYRHQTVETWSENCLSNIDAATESNGEQFIVRGNRQADAFQLSTGEGEVSLPPCIMSFAYWNPDFLKADRLLNAQTGEYEPVQVRHLGQASIDYQGQQIAANRYQLTVKEKPLTLWYAVADERWLALETVAEGGRILRYEPVSLPAAGDLVAPGPAPADPASKDRMPVSTQNQDANQPDEA